VVRAALRGLEPRNAERVAQHLVVAGTVVDDDPELALAHARAARDRASRVAAVREAVGVAAYHAGDYGEAARELRAYRRMTGDQSYRSVLADCERALGRPDVALRLVAEAFADHPDADEAVELRLVESGARRDLGETAAARLVLENALGGRPRPEMLVDADASVLRLAAAYADLLRGTGDETAAEEWTEALAVADPENLLGVAERAEVEFSEEDLPDEPREGELSEEPADDAANAGSDTDVPSVGEAHVDEADLDEADLDDSDRGEDPAGFRAQVEAEVAELLGETGAGEGEETGPPSTAD
jgi:tetratricopeptide (TPR) repeat protein